jgi:transposase
LKVDVKTVTRALKARPRAKRSKLKLDPFKPLIRELVMAKELSAVRVLEEIRALGYDGGYSILKEHVRPLRRRRRRRAHLRFETGKGEQAQVDLSPFTVELGGTPTNVVCFAMVFGYSRWLYIHFFLHADAHAVCHGHVLAFEEAGGVPHEILYDRMKQVVLESAGDHVVWHALFEALVRHYGFRAVPLAPGYCEGKGKIENTFLYILGGFLRGRTFHDLDDLNQQAKRWLREVASVRVHGTTRERPIDRMNDERPYLLPLPPRRFVAARQEERIVGYDFCVAYDTNRYSTPPRYAGRRVHIRVLEGILEVRADGEVIARHVVQTTRYRRHIAPEHEQEFRESSTSRHALKEQFLRLGSIAETFADELIKAHRGAAGYHMSQILKLADQFGAARVVEALRHAARYGAFHHTSVARIVRGRPGKRETPAALSEPVPTRIAEYLKGAGQRQRSLEDYAKRLRHKPAKKDEEDDHGK